MIGTLAYSGADTGRLMKDQPTWDIHPTDAYAMDGAILLARGGHLARNNAYARACINAMQNGAVGPHGLLWKSLYEAEPGGAVTDADRKLRFQLTRAVRSACRHIDAAGLLTYRQWEDSLVYGKAVHGAAIKVRVLTQRPHATHATAWRCIHPTRICNPNHAPDRADMYQGVQLDPNGVPQGLWVASRHPNRLVPTAAYWEYVPLVDANGLEQVIWHSARCEPEQIHAPGWFAPVMGLLVHLGKVQEAHVVAKRLQACLGMIVEADDPVAAAKKDRNGVAWTTNTTIEPGKTYYVRKGSNIRPFDFKYEGADFEAFTNALLQAVCAAFGPGIPSQFALQQLTKGNMASARAALMQAWRSFRREQVDHEHELRIVVKNYIAEDIARGRIILPTGDDLELACAGYFIPPQRLTSDDQREMQGAESKRKIFGVSRSTLAREYGGYDLDDERTQDAEDHAGDRRAGVTTAAPSDAADTYGVLVRAGALTPQADDEAQLRTRLGLPPPGPAVLKDWETTPTRQPITLAEEQAKPKPPVGGEDDGEDGEGGDGGEDGGEGEDNGEDDKP
jgi:capsid protein